MATPQLSNLQFLVLGVLRAESMNGRQVRDKLADFDIRKSGPAFYQMMSRLEAAGLVEGWYTQEIIDGQIIRERNYRIQAAGQSAWRRSRDFHLEIIRRFDDAGEPAGV